MGNVGREWTHVVHEGFYIGAYGREITVHTNVGMKDASRIQLFGNGLEAGGFGSGIGWRGIWQGDADVWQHGQCRPKK